MFILTSVSVGLHLKATKMWICLRSYPSVKIHTFHTFPTFPAKTVPHSECACGCCLVQYTVTCCTRHGVCGVARFGSNPSVPSRI